MAWNDALLKLPPVASMFGMVGAMDQAFGAEKWTCDFRGIGSCGCLAKVSVTVSEGVQVIREAFSMDSHGPWSYAEVAALRAYEFLGGKVNWPRVVPKVEQVPAALPKPSGTPSAKPMSHSLPSSYSGPVPYNDSHTNIPPVYFPTPPQEPDWFGKGITGFACWQAKNGKPASPWSKETTWREAVQKEVDNPGGWDQPLNYIMKCIGKEKQIEPNLRRPYADFIGKAKAACIWAMLAKDQKQQESEGYDEPGSEEGQSSLVPGEEVPW